MIESPAFSSFRKLLDSWDNYCLNEDRKQKISTLLDGQNLIMFFTKDGSVFGAPEESRVLFAKMKRPEELTDQNWIKDASFSALNLTKMLTGGLPQSIFNHNDMKTIHVIDKDEAEELLRGDDNDDNDYCSCGPQLVMTRPDHGDIPPNLVKMIGCKQ